MLLGKITEIRICVLLLLMQNKNKKHVIKDEPIYKKFPVHILKDQQQQQQQHPQEAFFPFFYKLQRKCYWTCIYILYIKHINSITPDIDFGLSARRRVSILRGDALFDVMRLLYYIDALVYIYKEGYKFVLFIYYIYILRLIQVSSFRLYI